MRCDIEPHGTVLAAPSHPSHSTGLGACALQDHLHARDQFAWAERLGDVIVAADLEADHAIHFIGARGQKKNRYFRALANLAANRETVHFRHGDIENHQVRL